MFLAGPVFTVLELVFFATWEDGMRFVNCDTACEIYQMELEIIKQTNKLNNKKEMGL